MRFQAVLLLLFCLSACTAKEDRLYGEVEATEIDIGVKIPGRLGKILVGEGAAVKKDEVMALLESPEVKAKLKTATAGKSVARQQLELARTTYDRVEKLYQMGAVTRQQRDEAQLKYNNAQQQVRASEGIVSEVTAAEDETSIKSPIDGEVLQIVSHLGELVAPGYPVITVVDLTDQWVVFNVREDRLSDFLKGVKVQVEIPALKKSFDMTVTYVSALGSFATWKATNEQGRVDLKTFEVRARPADIIPNLRPGMTALVKK